MAAKHKIVWSDRAVKDLDLVYNCLREEWSTKEAETLLDLVQEFERLISHYPDAFTLSKKYRHCRLGLIHRNLTAVYNIPR